MSTDKRYGTIADHQLDAVLGTAYGDESADWTTEGIDVSMFDWVTFEFTYADHDSATTLTFAFYQADRDAADLDDYVPILADRDADGTVTPLELTRAVSDDVVEALPPIDVRAISMLRVAAKVDDATNDPTLTLRYLGHRSSARGAESSPNVTA